MHRIDEFLILITVQLKLIYNTYMLSNRNFNLAEKKLPEEHEMSLTRREAGG